MRKHISKLFFLAFLICFFSIFFIFKLNRFFTYENIIQVKYFILNFSILGPIVIILLFIIFNLAVLPTFYFIFISGYLYGPIYGFILGWFGMIIGLLASFINTRYIFKDDFIKKFGSNKIVKMLDEYIKKYHGWAVIFFRIFFIVPYNIQNTAYGLTDIKLYIYTICSAIGILPTTILYVFLGNLFVNNKININGIKNIVLYLIIFIALFASIFFTSLILRRKFKYINDEQ